MAISSPKVHNFLTYFLLLALLPRSPVSMLRSRTFHHYQVLLSSSHLFSPYLFVGGIYLSCMIISKSSKNEGIYVIKRASPRKLQDTAKSHVICQLPNKYNVVKKQTSLYVLLWREIGTQDEQLLALKSISSWSLFIIQSNISSREMSS